jgi:tetratricopeptide (TPR) repeat protein/predicted Ser/Thr protein kinase
MVLPEGLEIGHRYRVVKLLGQGGMGAVYRVHDQELERDVALKLIRPELSWHPEVLARFKREIQLSSQVTHPNVLRVYDLGESDTIKFLTMQFVDGEDLATRIRREGRLQTGQLVEVFRQICQGLAAAHKQGVTHRDLKPQNIMIDRQGQVYLMDFGLAQSIELSGLTETGAVMGTPYYMSPEQVKGEKVDSRSDIYSLGVILYEMASGQVPYSGGSTYQVMIRRVTTPPRPVTELNPELPGYLVRILDKCLAIDKSLRYGSADEILTDLDRGSVSFSLLREIRKRAWLQYALLMLLLVAAGWGVYAILPKAWFARGVDVAREAQQNVPVLGVANFVIRTGDSSQDWYGPGLARLVADSLAGSRHVRVVSLARMEALQKANPGTAELVRAAAQGGIGYLLTGEILPGQGGLTIAARLTETGKGEEVEARRIDNLTPETLLKSSDKVALVAKRGLRLPLTGGVDVYSGEFATRNTEAYEKYVLGLRELTQYRYGPAEAEFREALKLAPDFTMARYRLSTVLATTGRMDDAIAEIGKAEGQVAGLSDLEARYVRAAAAWYQNRYPEAIKSYSEILEKYPYENEARYFLAVMYMETSRFQDEIPELEALAKVEPELPHVWSMLGDAYMRTKQFSQAVTALLRYAELEPKSPNASEMLGNCYRAQGELDLAIREYDKALKLDTTFYFATRQMAVTLFLKGEMGRAEGLLRQLVEGKTVPVRNRLDAAFDLASVYRSEGRFEQAERLLAGLAAELAKEQVRESLALSTRGLCLMEMGKYQEAGRLIKSAVEHSPGTPTRYLFARGVLENRRKDSAAVKVTAQLILKGSLPPDNPDRTEEKAAAFIRGLADLGEGRNDQAVQEFTRCLSLSGYEYSIYRVALGRAYLAAGRLPEALAAARQAAAPLDPVDPRLDLALDRLRAELLLAQVQASLGQASDASASAKRLAEVWRDAPATFADLAEAKRLVALR